MIAIFTVENILALLTLTTLEIVLGIDNIVFIAILSSKLPKHLRNKAQRIGLALAMIMRIALLLTISWIIHLTDKWLTFNLIGIEFEFSWRDLILLVGGLFLIGKGTFEIHDKLEVPNRDVSRPSAFRSFGLVITQIILMDMIFSLDSVMTAVGMARALWVMITAIVIAVGVMMIFAKPISDFVERHPTMKMLALSFLLMIGVMLVAEGFGKHIEKGYIYFAMAFSLFVELLNIRIRKVTKPVSLHQPHLPANAK